MELNEQESADYFAEYFHSVYSAQPPRLSVEDAGQAGGAGGRGARAPHRAERRPRCPPRWPASRPRPPPAPTACCLLDDIKLFLEIRSEEDAIRLQQDIDRVVAWGCDNKLEFNGSKCVQMTFSRAREPLRHQYTLGGGALARVSSVRDLGVKFTSTLSFSDHIVNICKGAFKTLGFVLRSCQDFTDILTVKALYNALVRSKLESNAVIWAPHEIKYNLMLERMVGYSKIEVRRDLALTKMVFMVFRGWLCNPTVLESIGLAVPAGGCGLRRRAGRLLAAPTARTNLLHEAPVTRAIRLINKASERTDILTCSLGEFVKNSVVIMDNAAYHSTQIDRKPTMSSLKIHMQEWLTRKNVPFNESARKCDLMNLINQ
ncbi:unnamed protein product [Plutella xylostella]|uniref:(diamondback moth) hypothetical protein n=1 Tax=Plutella xylostella TaxID=51655 RepID=A0A8S4FCI7_PLUXY|nr:unnamed protein product [Plutella xylostella]